MGIFKGGALRLLQTALYALTLCCAAIVLGIFSYFLAHLTSHNLDIPTRWKTVEGISGVAVLYTLATTLLTCCLAGIAFLSILGLILDILFMGGFVAIAILTRGGADSCSGNVRTPIGNGPTSNVIGSGYTPNLGTACRLNKTVFAVSIAAAVLFFITALMQLALIRHHKKEKRFGPSPSNNYTSGTTQKKGVFARKNKASPDHAEKGILDADRSPLPAGSTIRPSHDTAYSGHTAVATNGPTVIQKEGLSHDGHAPHVGWNPHDNERATAPPLPTSIHGGYYTTPVGTAEPYGTTLPTNGVARDF